MATVSVGLMLFAVACARPGYGTPVAVAAGDIATPGIGQPDTNKTPGALQSRSAYLVLSTAQSPYLHRLIRVPTSCILAQSECPPPEVIAAYPGQGVTPSHLHWAPNGQEALILDTYQPRVLRFDPSSASLTTLMGDVPTIRDEMVWLPDGRPAFVIQGAGDYVSELVALQRGLGKAQLQTLAAFDGIAYLMGIDTTGHVLIRLDIYGFPAGTPSLKKEVVKVRLLAIDPAAGTVTEPWPYVEWLSLSPQTVLPDGSQLLIGVQGMGLWDLKTGVVTTIGSDAVSAVGSPNRLWLAIVATSSDHLGFAARVLRLDTGQARDLARLPSSPRLYWAPDSRNLVMVETGSEASASSSPLHVVSIQGGLPATPRLDLAGYPVVEDISWGP